MGNCAGCAAPQRSYRVERLQQHSPIKNRLSQGGVNKFYPQSGGGSGVKEFSLGGDRVPERGSFNQNQMFGNIFGLAQSKSRPVLTSNDAFNNGFQSSNLFANPTSFGNHNSVTGNDFSKDILSQVVKTHIKLYPDNPQNQRQTSPSRIDKSFHYQKQQDLRTSKLQGPKNLSAQSYSNQLLKSVQSESKNYIRQISNRQKSNQKLNQSNQIRSSFTVPLFNAFQNSPNQHNMPRFDDISQIRTTKTSKNQAQQENSLPLKKYSKYNRDLTVIEQILHEENKTPFDIKQQRKNNGEDVIFDTFQGFPQELEPLQIPNLAEYLSALKLIQQKS